MARDTVDLTDLLAPWRRIFLDFDGPVCNLFRGKLTGGVVVERLAAIVSASGLCPQEEIPQTEDALEVLKLAHRVDPTLAQRVEHVLAQAETEAAQTAPPTRHAEEFIRTAIESGRTLAIVSNNSPVAIETYLAVHGLVVNAIIGRTDADPAPLKPSPYLLRRAMTALASEPAECVLVGDSTTDIAAARSAHMTSIGHANTAGKVSALAGAGADSVVQDIRALTMGLAAD
jgi:HAD superfamily hydrolase (TIGR01509 family)